MIINGNHEHGEGVEQGPKITQITEQWEDLRKWLLSSEAEAPRSASLPRCSNQNKKLSHSYAKLLGEPKRWNIFKECHRLEGPTSGHWAKADSFGENRSQLIPFAPLKYVACPCTLRQEGTPHQRVTYELPYVACSPWECSSQANIRH